MIWILVGQIQVILGVIISKWSTIPWTTDAQPNEAFFHWNPELLGLGGQIGQTNSGTFGVFSAKLSTQWVPCPFFLLFNHYFYKKNYIQIQLFIWYICTYLLWIGIWIWAAKIRDLALCNSIDFFFMKYIPTSATI